MKEVWIFRTGSLGDALITLPAIQRIRELHPSAKLALLTDEPGKGIVSAWDVLQYSGALSHAIVYRPGSLKSLLLLFLRVRKAKPEALYYLAPRRGRLQIWRDCLFFGMLGRIPAVVGLERLRTPRRRGLAAGVGAVPREADRLLRLVDPGAALESLSGKPLLHVPEPARQEAAALLREAGWREGQPMMVLAVGSKMPAKRWPTERYAELGSNLLRRFPDLFFVLLGSEEEHDLSQQVCGAWGIRAANFAGKTSLIQSAAILQRCLLYVGNDTGTMHLAAAMGTPCVALFSARDEAGKWDPFGTRNRILRSQVECAGCMLVVCADKGMQCLTQIKVEEAESAVVSLLSEIAP